jgi:micrococcal nuclease
MRKLILLIAIFLIANYAHSAGANGQNGTERRWVGVVTHVTDGDTLWVRAAGAAEAVKIRLEALDAPEICQTGGQASRQVLAALTMGQVVVVQPRRHDSYGRVLAKLSVHGQDLGSTLVAQGQAWSYSGRAGTGPYATQQAHARAARRGLFADPKAQEPRQFRKQHGSCHA